MQSHTNRGSHVTAASVSETRDECRIRIIFRESAASKVPTWRHLNKENIQTVFHSSSHEAERNRKLNEVR